MDDWQVRAPPPSTGTWHAATLPVGVGDEGERGRGGLPERWVLMGSLIVPSGETYIRVKGMGMTLALKLRRPHYTQENCIGLGICA